MAQCWKQLSSKIFHHQSLQIVPRYCPGDSCRLLSSGFFSTTSNNNTTTPTGATAARSLSLRDVDRFRTILQNEAGSLYTNLLSTDEIGTEPPDTTGTSSILEYASIDWTRQFRSVPTTPLVLRPQTVEQVSMILQYCHEHGIPVVPQGGKTGLVGGGVPHSGNEVVLQLERLNQILAEDGTDVHPVMGLVKCQAGVVLEQIQQYCAARELLFPIDLGAKGSCQIGGNLATNAGGQYYHRYKSLCANVLGLQVVLADGRVMDWNFSKCNVKDNTGYKLFQLMIGSEGTLGIITAIAMGCPPFPASRQTAIVVCPTYDAVMKTISSAKKYLAEILAAMEWMDTSVWDLVSQVGHGQVPLLSKETHGDSPMGPYYILVETHGSNTIHDRAKMDLFIEASMNQNLVMDGVIAQDMKQAQEFWRIRESCNPTIARLGCNYKYDISLPVNEFEDFILEMKTKRLDALDNISVVNANWGHILDGNLHYNVVTKDHFNKQPEVLAALEPYLFESILRRGGSISAEHGLGQSKKDLLSMVHDHQTLHFMRDVKRLFDPKNILNPGKYFPDSLF